MFSMRGRYQEQVARPACPRCMRRAVVSVLTVILAACGPYGPGRRYEGPGFVQVALGQSSACARTYDGQVWCWVGSESGDEGWSPTTPFAIEGVDDAVDLAAGPGGMCV